MRLWHLLDQNYFKETNRQTKNLENKTKNNTKWPKLLLPNPDVEQIALWHLLPARNGLDFLLHWDKLFRFSFHPGKHHFTLIFISSLLTLIHMVLGALARMLAWCHEKYSSTWARFFMSDGYQWSGVLYFRLRYSRMAVLLRHGDKKEVRECYRMLLPQTSFICPGINLALITKSDKYK